MTHKRMPPDHFFLTKPGVPGDFPSRLDDFKRASGLTWEGVADCIGVDLRQLHRWRLGTSPSGPALYALFQLAVKVPDGLSILLAKRSRQKHAGTGDRRLSGDQGRNSDTPNSALAPPGRQLQLEVPPPGEARQSR